MKTAKILLIAAALCLCLSGCAFDGDNFNPNLHREIGVSLYV